MEWADVLARIRRGADEQTEFKTYRGPDDLDGIARAVCAFSNSDGGLVVIGVRDDGTTEEVAEPAEHFSERLTTLLQSGLSQPVGARLGRGESEGRSVHWIEVRRYHGPEPLRRRGRISVRRGRASVEPSGAELQDLFNTFGFVVTEEQCVPGSSAREIDPEQFREFLRRLGIDPLEEPRPDLERDLLNKKILSEHLDERLATVYGLLCFGRDPQGVHLLGNAYLELCAYAGSDRAADVLYRGAARGTLDEQVRRAVAWVRDLGTREEYSGLVRKDVPLLPERAVREAITNAVAHRDYAILGSKVLLEVFADRVVVSSPGELPNRLTPESVLSGGVVRARNQLIAQFLTVMGLMEQRGRGLMIIRKELRTFNGTDLDLQNDPVARQVRLTMVR